MINFSISSLLLSHNEKMSSVYRFQIIGSMTLLLRSCVSISAIKISSNATAVNKIRIGSDRTGILAFGAELLF